MLVIKIGKNIMEKREYISPVAEIVELGTFDIMQTLVTSREQIGDEGQMSNEFRGDSDWSNIWGNM